MSLSVALTAGAGARERESGLWLCSRRWDLVFISGSALLVVLPFVAYEVFNVLLGMGPVRAAAGVAPGDVLDVSRNAVNALIAVGIGGPHMYATYSRTFFDRDFRRKRPLFLLGSLIIPAGVIALGLFNFQLLATFFFFWASVHIMHQMAYILDCYNGKVPRPTTWRDRLIDYVVVFSSLYPIAVWKMVHGGFRIGQIEILFPAWLTLDVNPSAARALVALVGGTFAVSLALWLRKTYAEHLRGELHGPKILLMALTIGISFVIPSYRELDVAFQGFNTWHSFQYLGLTIWINRLRARKGEIGTPWVAAVSGEGRGWAFYGVQVLISLGAVAGIAVLLANRAALGLSFDQCYYMVVLSFLLMHYLHDHLLFTRTDALTA